MVLLARGGDALALGAHPPGQVDEEGQQEQREGGQAPVEEEHRHHGGDHRGDVGDDRGGGGGDDALDAADVVGDPRLDLARASAREEGEREALEVAVDGRAQVVHDPLADRVGDPRLGDADDAGGDGDRDHPQHQRGEQRGVALGDRLVEDLAQQEGRDHAQAGGEEDQAEQPGQSQPVVPEQASDPAEVGSPGRSILGTLDVVAGCEGPAAVAHAAIVSGSRAGSSASSSTSSTVMTGWKVICSRTSSGTSSRSPRLRSGRITSVRPAACAASTFCLSPPIGSTRPWRVTSPVMPTVWRTGRPLQQRRQRRRHRDARARAVLRDRARRHVHVELALVEGAARRCRARRRGRARRRARSAPTPS